MKFLLYHCAVICTMLVHTSLAKRVIRTDRVYDNRDNPVDSPVSIELRVTHDRSVGSFIHGQIRISRDIPVFQLKLLVTRCEIREAPDTCESFSANPSHTCEFLSMDNTLWSPFFKKIEPPFHCPLKKGTYNLVNGSFELDYLKFFPMDSYYMAVNYRVYERKRLIVSFSTDFRILDMTRR